MTRKRKESRAAAATAAAKRSLDLLWGRQAPPARGPKPGLTLEQIIAQAIAIADAEGLPAVSMRRIADELEVAPMSLYTYVPSKRELIELMCDAVEGDQRSALAGDGWRAKLDGLAHSMWDHYHRHRWLLHVPWARASMGPNALDSYERALAVVAGLGLNAREMTNVITMLGTFVRGAAQVAIDELAAQQHDGLSDAEWWAARAPLLDELLDPARYPLLTDPAMQAAFDIEIPEGTQYGYAQAMAAFEFGLRYLLDGIGALIAKSIEQRP